MDGLGDADTSENPSEVLLEVQSQEALGLRPFSLLKSILSERHDPSRSVPDGEGADGEGSDDENDVLSKFLAGVPAELPLGERWSRWVEKLSLWLGPDLLRLMHSRRDVAQQLDRDIAMIDGLVSRQLNAILHHSAFQKLEASWRGLHHLVACQEKANDDLIKIKVWNLTWRMLRDDLEGAVEFDQSQFFKKIYEEEIGTAGWQAFSAILMDFEIHPRPSREHKYDDLPLLQAMSATAAAAFAPLFIGAHPSMFQIDRYSELKPSNPIETMYQQAEFTSWRSFRQMEDSRFVTMLLPRMLIRQPYRPEVNYEFGFLFEETTASSEDYLWGNPIWGMGEVLIRAFAESRWFANIRGLTQGVATGGLVRGPAHEVFATETRDTAPKPITETIISDHFERRLTRLGFTPLCATKFGSEAVFYSIASAQQPKRYNDPIANTNAELSALTNYILCASRFGHYVKFLSREKIGSLIGAYDIETYLSDWLMSYVNRDPDASVSARASAPLLDASVVVNERLGRPGDYDCVVQLEPFHGFDDVRASVKLDTRLTRRQ
ncbi:MAG: type VI secretion system contractile sheath large subunit [Planctomycetota bacterium]|jgi:type VI secretion system protein ImpD